ncbi:hypothetical protein BKI52_38600 [marine bacterium AO1-C]|nr:hypothetical protein BKI52_38600 [marine bacterium AO1-C]
MKTLKSLAAFILTIFVFAACNQQEGLNPTTSDDAALIDAIQSATKQEVNVSALPTSSQDEVNGECSRDDKYIATARLADGLGYEVSMRQTRGSEVGDETAAYFDLNGRRLSEDGGQGGKPKGKKGRRKDCFDFVYPVTFTMPDSSNITVTDSSGWSAVKGWYEANPDVKDRPSINFPVDITFEDGTTKTITNEDEMRDAKSYCGGTGDRRGGDKTPCFDLTYPVNITMPDGTNLTIESKEGWSAVKEWHRNNPDATERGALQFPVTITYEDGSTQTINNEDEMRAARENCGND